MHFLYLYTTFFYYTIFVQNEENVDDLVMVKKKIERNW